MSWWEDLFLDTEILSELDFIAFQLDAIYVAETLSDGWFLLSQVSFYPATGQKVDKSNWVCCGIGKPRGYERLSQVRAGDLLRHGLEEEGFPRQSNLASTWDECDGDLHWKGGKKWGGPVRHPSSGREAGAGGWPQGSTAQLCVGALGTAAAANGFNLLFPFFSLFFSFSFFNSRMSFSVILIILSFF